jgi:DNA-binding CsgD family transcriptional regulator
MEANSGNLDVAWAYLREAERRTSAPGNELNRAQVLMHGVLVRGLRGDVDRARRDADEAIAIARAHRFARPIRWTATARAMLEHSLGNPAGAWSAVEELIPGVEESGVGDPGAFHFVPEAIQALVGLGDLDRAERLLTTWERRAHELDRGWALVTGARCRAVLAVTRRDWSGADDAVATALAAHERVELPIELGRTHLVEGQMRRRRKEKLAARRALESAADVFERSGAVIWRQRAEDELERVGSGRRAGHLSATEAQVAALVAEGKTNRQVAAEMFISPTTVKANLGRVFRTLGVQTRSELAARWEGHTGAHP